MVALVRVAHRLNATAGAQIARYHVAICDAQGCLLLK
jgi:hypothetical protein